MDGEITIGTSLSTDKFDRQVAQLERKMEKEENKKIKVQADLGSLEEEFQIAIKKTNELAEAYQRLEQLQKAISSGKATPEQFTMAQDIQNTYGSMQQLETSFLRALNKQDAIELKARATKEKYEEINQKVAEYKQKIESVKLEKQVADANKLKEKFNNVGSSIQGAITKVAKLALGVFGVRSAFMALRRASSDLAGYDKQYAANLEYIRYALTQAIAPVLQWIVGLASKLLGYINAILNGWFGINLFSRGSAENFNKMKKTTSGISKATKEIKKQLAGFDEINMLTDQSDTGTKAGTSGLATPSFDLSDVKKGFSFIDEIKEKWKKFVGYLENTDWQKVGRNFVKAIKGWFTNIKWSEIASSISEGVGAILGAIAGFVSGAVQEIWKNIKEYFKPFIEEAKEAGGGIALGILLGIVNIFKKIGEWIDTNIFKPFIKGFKKAFGIESPSKVMQEMGKFIVEGLFNGLKNIWEKIKTIITTLVENVKKALSALVQWLNEKVITPIKTFFEKLWKGIQQKFNEAWEGIKGALSAFKSWTKEKVVTPIKDAFANMWNKFKDGGKNAWSGIKTTFSAVGSFFKTTFEKAWKSVKDIFSTGGKIFDGIKEGIVTSFKTIVNAIIRGINKIIIKPFEKINSILNRIKNVKIFELKPFDFISTISVPQIPQLKTGGIVNMPNRGTMVGGAIAGESGREGVLPLTDQQTMAELGREIGRHVLVNLTNITTMNGRVIGRELKQVQSEQEFAFNS